VVTFWAVLLDVIYDVTLRITYRQCIWIISTEGQALVHLGHHTKAKFNSMRHHLLLKYTSLSYKRWSLCYKVRCHVLHVLQQYTVPCLLMFHWCHIKQPELARTLHVTRWLAASTSQLLRMLTSVTHHWPAQNCCYYYYHHHHFLSQVFFLPWYFSSWANGEPHHSGFKSQLVALSLWCVMFLVWQFL
jgi:hypothetical protein